MTTNESPMTKLATFMADILEGDLPNVDILDMLALLKPFMPGPAFEELSLTFDMCPIHLTDLDSCADDDSLKLDGPMFGKDIPLAACRHLRQRHVQQAEITVIPKNEE
jgi:hypothetical protein